MAPARPGEPTFDGRLTRREDLILIGVGLLALGLRLAYLWGQARNNPLFELVRGDAYDHHAWAQAIAFGSGMEAEPYYRAPLYYHLLSGLYLLVGPSVVWARIAGAFLGSLTAYAIARLGAGLWGYRAGLAAGLLAAIYWPAIYFDAELLTVGLECFLEVALVLALVVATDRNSLRRLVLAGAIWGLAIIARPNFLALAPAIAAWLFIALPGARFGRRKWIAAAAVGLGAACLVAPVTLRNAWVGGEPIFIAYSGGVNFYIGNNPDSDGVSAVLPGGRRSLRGGYEDAHKIPEADLGRPLAASEISDYWFAKGAEWILAEPGAAADHLWHKLRLFWSPVELPNNQPIRFFFERAEISALLFVGFPWLAVLGLAGFVLVRDKWGKWFLPGTFLLIYMGTVVLFFCNARYRLPVFPLLALGAGAGLAALPDLLRQRRWPALALYAGVGLAVALTLATNPPHDRAGFYQANRGEGHKDLGDLYASAPLSDGESQQAALAQFEEAVRLKPASPYLQLALARQQALLGDFQGALGRLASATREFPGNAELRLEYGRILTASENWLPARRQFEAAVELQPAYAAAQQGLGCLLITLGDFQAALAPLQAAIDLQAHPLEAALCLGDAQLGLRNTEAALSQFETALELDPLSPQALQRLGDIHLIRGDLNPAIAHYRMALKQKADLPASSQNLANSLRVLGQYAEAITVLEQAVTHSPRDVELLTHLAFALAATPQPHLRSGARALGFAERAAAAESQPGIVTLDARAAALAELGRFAEAIEAIRLALALAQTQGRADLVPVLEIRLRSYQADRPYRDPGPTGASLP
jgi:tetratricopeptide (TPR) repeat protein/4-amino-4-deoxy-L-arabinose transferase-like glycosyltransferase